MNINKQNEIIYNQAKEKANEIIKLLESIKCDDCEGCPLNKYDCSRYDIIDYLDCEFN